MSKNTEVNINRGSAQYQRQTPFNQLVMPFIQALAACGVVWAVFRSVLLSMYLLGELQLVVFWLAAFALYKLDKTAWGIGFSAAGVYAWISFFLWKTEYVTAFMEWTEFRVILTFVSGVVVPVVGYIVFKRMTTDIQFPNLVDSVTALKGKFKRRVVADEIEGGEKDERAVKFTFGEGG